LGIVFGKVETWLARRVECEVVDVSFPAHQKMWVTEHGPCPTIHCVVTRENYRPFTRGQHNAIIPHQDINSFNPSCVSFLSPNLSLQVSHIILNQQSIMSSR
jgi:hypothetical protein